MAGILGHSDVFSALMNIAELRPSRPARSPSGLLGAPPPFAPRASATTSTPTRRCGRRVSSTSSCSARRARRSWLDPGRPEPAVGAQPARRRSKTEPPGRLDRRRHAPQLRLPGRHGLDVRQAGRRPRGPHPPHGGREELPGAARRPASGDAVLSSYRDGKATELGRGQRDARAPLGAVLGRRPRDRRSTVLFNDQKLFEATDPKPATGGRASPRRARARRRSTSS